MGGIKTAFTEAMLGDGMTRAARSLRKFGRALRRAPRTIRYYHRVDDPRSWLLASVLGPFVDTYGLAIEVEVVPDPAAEVDPEPELRAKFDVEDTRRLAKAFGLVFPEPGSEPVAARVRMANALALAPRPHRERLERLTRISELLLSRKGDALAKMADETGTTRGQDLRPALESAYARLRKHGHYTSAVVEFEGELYAGVERLAHLERRLVGEGLDDHALAPSLAMPAPVAGAAPIEVELFFSYRSPYSYVGLERAVAISESYGLVLKLQPVLPMVMRGLSVPTDKRVYIVRDAKREADAHGIPFGKIADPVGVGIERVLAVHVHAERAESADRAGRAGRAGLTLRFARAAMAAIWARGVDVATDEGLALVAADAGLDADFVRDALADDSWRDVVERHRDAMYEAGLWGVPTFRVGNFATWGQDRLPLVVAEANRLRGR